MLLSILLLAATFSVDQGKPLLMTVPDEAGVKSISFVWEGKTASFARTGGQWTTVVGVDLDTPPGPRSGEVVVRFADDHVDKRPVTLQVGRVSFPTTQLKVEDKYVELSPANQRRSATEARELDAIYARSSAEILWTPPFRSPIPGQNRGSNFGHRRVFNGQARAPHAGADLKASTGTAIHATNRGRVVLAKNLFFTGNTVILDHGLGLYTIYAHLSRMDAKLNAVVESGVILGLAGATGRVTGPHLHWSARIQGARVDPFGLLSIE